MPVPDAVIAVRARVAAGFVSGTAIEIGALDAPTPLPSSARVRYVDLCPARTFAEHYPELDPRTVASDPLRYPMNKRICAPPELNRNAPRVQSFGPEFTGQVIMKHVCERMGVGDLSGMDILDIGCGVRFTQAIVNCAIPIGTYTGIEVDPALVEWLNENVDDDRFAFQLWPVRNAMYNPSGTPMGDATPLPVSGTYDLIWMFSVITHMTPEDAATLLKLARAHVREGGSLFFTAFCDDAVERFLDRTPNPLENAVFNTGYLRGIVQGAGWRIDSEAPHNRDVFMQHSFLCRPERPQGAA